MKARHGASVFRVGLNTCGDISGKETPSPLPSTSALRDDLVRSMVRLNDRFGATRFLAHLELPDGDWAPNDLENLIEECLGPSPVVGLVLEAPPARMTTEVLALLEARKRSKEIWLEVPVQPSRRGPWTDSSSQDASSLFAAAARLSRNYSIPVIGRVILGLPGEHEAAWLSHAALFNRLRIAVVKVHPFQVFRASPHEASFRKGEILSLDLGGYMDALIGFLERLDPAIRILGLGKAGSHAGLLIAPLWVRQCQNFHDELEARLQARKSYQGRLVEQ